MVIIKRFRKLIWSKSKAMVALRISELMFAGLDPKKKYLYSVLPETEKVTIQFKRARL